MSLANELEETAMRRAASGNLTRQDLVNCFGVERGAVVWERAQTFKQGLRRQIRWIERRANEVVFNQEF